MAAYKKIQKIHWQIKHAGPSAGRGEGVLYIMNYSTSYFLSEKLRFTPEEADQINELCEDHGITVDNLISQFLCDLIDNNRSGGSDERMMVNDWFHRSFWDF